MLVFLRKNESKIPDSSSLELHFLASESNAVPYIMFGFFLFRYKKAEAPYITILIFVYFPTFSFFSKMVICFN